MLWRPQSSDSADKCSTRQSQIKPNQCLSLRQQAELLCGGATVQLVDSSCEWWQKPLSDRPSLTVMCVTSWTVLLSGSVAALHAQENWMHTGNKPPRSRLSYRLAFTGHSQLTYSCYRMLSISFFLPFEFNREGWVNVLATCHLKVGLISFLGLSQFLYCAVL